LGGWKTNWELSYNLPTRQYLYQEEKNPKNFVLKQKFGMPFEKILCQDYTLKVIFPEGADDIQVDIPYTVDQISSTTTKSYLDFVGRPTLIINKKNVLPDHNKIFQASYTFES